jgi:hypothetical protein
MGKENLPEDTRFVITDRHAEYTAIANGLLEKDQAQFWDTMNQPFFKEDRIAVNVFGEKVMACLDEESLEQGMRNLGYTERITRGQARSKVIYKAKRRK